MIEKTQANKANIEKNIYMIIGKVRIDVQFLLTGRPTREQKLDTKTDIYQ